MNFKFVKNNVNITHSAQPSEWKISVKYFFYILFLSFLLSCSENSEKDNSKTKKYQFQETNFPNGKTENVKYIRVKDEPYYVKDIYENGNLFRLAKRFKNDSFIITERFWYQSNGFIMNYKCYVNDQLILYSDYNLKGQLIKVDGSPLLYLDKIRKEYVIEQDIDYVRIIHIIKPPKTKLNIWIDGDIETPALEEITRGNDHLTLCKIEGDSTGYILELNDTALRKFPILWSINDSLNNKILKAGKHIDLFRGKTRTTKD